MKKNIMIAIIFSILTTGSILGQEVKNAFMKPEKPGIVEKQDGPRGPGGQGMQRGMRRGGPREGMMERGQKGKMGPRKGNIAPQCQCPCCKQAFRSSMGRRGMPQSPAFSKQ